MRNNNTIQTLESIPKATIYSKYGESLDRLFKSRSLKNLIFELKNPKKLNSKELESSEVTTKKKLVKYSEEDFKDIFSSLEKEQQNKKDKPIKDNNKTKIEIIKYKPRGFIQNTEFIDPFKYNPNYNSISKNIPSVRMVLNDKEIEELKKNRERQKSSKIRKISNLKKKNILPKIKTKDEQSFITSLTEGNKKLSRNNSSKRRESTLPPIFNIPKQKQRAITIENDQNLRNNHALRFSKYISRQFDLNNRDKINKISYLEPYDYLNNKNNNSIDFKKMAYRKEKDLIYSSSLEVPSIYDYNPKYNLVEKKPAQVVFSPHNDIKNTKLYLLKKLWSSYEVTSDYKLINQEKI